MESVPTSALAGEPLSCPVMAENVAQFGLFVMENVSVSPAGPLAVGVKIYALPAVTDVAGVPLIVSVAGSAFTVTANAGRDAARDPLLTLILMFVKLPMFADVGVPNSRPLVELKFAHEG